MAKITNMQKETFKELVKMQLLLTLVRVKKKNVFNTKPFDAFEHKKLVGLEHKFVSRSRTRYQKIVKGYGVENAQVMYESYIAQADKYTEDEQREIIKEYFDENITIDEFLEKHGGAIRHELN